MDVVTLGRLQVLWDWLNERSNCSSRSEHCRSLSDWRANRIFCV